MTDHDAVDPEVLELAEKLFEAARGGDTAFLQRYLEAGLPSVMTNAAGDSLLMLAAYHGHAGTVAALLAAGADPNTLNDRGQSPLAGAVFKGYAEVCRELLAAGADPDAGTPTARDAAQMFRRQDILDLLAP